MGEYTELLLKVELKKNLPKEVVDVLNFLFNEHFDEPEVLPSHDFFLTERWRNVGCGCSGYHIPWSTSFFSENRIFSRSDFKNYNGELDDFIDWITPYIYYYDRKCIGWKWYNGEPEPELIYVGE